MTADNGRYADDTAFATLIVVGRISERLRAERVAGAAEAADHFVVDEEDAVAVEHRLHLLVVAGRRNDDAARTHDRLRDERGDRVRPFRFDQRFEVADDAIDERRPALSPGLPSR